MRRINISCSSPYVYSVGDGLISSFDAPVSGKKTAIISDGQVSALYSRALEKRLTSLGAEVYKYILPCGEQAKSFDVLMNILSFLSGNGFSRCDTVAALGGGCVSDVAGLAAALYMRGCGYIIFPTTLLSMLDASVGGKTAVNYNGLKNNIGTFYQPDAVFADTVTLGTLPKEQYACGMAEAIKCAVISGGELWRLVCEGGAVGDIIAMSVSLKAELVSEDEYDTGARRLLNLGHTFAHAVEGASKGGIPHGYAVASGLYSAAKLAVFKGIANVQLPEDIKALLMKYNLPFEPYYPLSELIPFMMGDKKHSSTYKFILPSAPGKCDIYDAGNNLDIYFEGFEL